MSANDGAIEKRRSYDELDRIRRRLGRMAGEHKITPGQFELSCKLIEDLKLTIAGDDDVKTVPG